jgi:hypothetical protein
MSATKRAAAPPPALPRATVWTAERIDKLTVAEAKQLRENAERLDEPVVAALCTESLKGRPRPPRPAVAVKAAPKKPKAPGPA